MESCPLHFDFTVLVIASFLCPMAAIDFSPHNYNFSKFCAILKYCIFKEIQLSVPIEQASFYVVNSVVFLTRGTQLQGLFTGTDL